MKKEHITLKICIMVFVFTVKKNPMRLRLMADVLIVSKKNFSSNKQ